MNASPQHRVQLQRDWCKREIALVQVLVLVQEHAAQEEQRLPAWKPEGQLAAGGPERQRRRASECRGARQRGG